MLIIDPWPSRTYDNKFVFLWMIEDNRVKELPVSCEIDTSATYLYMYIHVFQQRKNNRCSRQTTGKYWANCPRKRGRGWT